MSRDERAARKWVNRMLEAPKRHRAGLLRWIDGRPERLALYNDIMGAVNHATAAARTISMEHVLSAKAERASVLHLPRARMLGLAAAVIIIGTILFTNNWHTSWDHDPATPSSAVAVAGTYRTRVGEVRTVRLSDGSIVTLDTDTEITVRFTGDERGTDLEHGRARFEVAHDPAHPFIVYAAGGRVTATGTIFDVTNRDGFAVHLIRGSIDVAPPPRPDVPTAQALHLSPGQKIAFLPHPNGPLPSPVPARPSDAQWVTGMKTFDDVPIRDIIAEANSYSLDTITLADPAVGDVHGFIDLNIRDTAAVAGKLATYLHLAVDRSESGKIILRPQK